MIKKIKVIESNSGNKIKQDDKEVKEIKPVNKINKEKQVKKEIIIQDKKSSFKDEIISSEEQLDLKFLEDTQGNALIARKKSVFINYGDDASLFIAKINEKNKFNEKKVLMDSLTPHVVFVCGSRGSGKSYSLGVLAEELALKNPNIGTIVIDPVGVFWSMRFPNKEKKELSLLKEWDLKAKGLNNLKVFIPAGAKEITPKQTYDAIFSIQPSLLTAEDWSLTFGIERFSPTGLLLDQLLKKVEIGYTNKEGIKVNGKGKDYSIDDLVFCLNNDFEFNSKEKGFKGDSIRALSSRLEASKSWGIFSEKGTPLIELSKEGQLTVIDSSFLDENVTALIIGILARRILNARKIVTRQESVKRIEDAEVDELLEIGIPPTWLFIDEAHTLIPSGNYKTPASDAIIEYVKQGRRPGCSLVFATQQPSAIDSKVLSQLDILISYKLVFDEDIKAVFKRIPTIVPKNYKKPSFVKTLPIGIAILADRSEETSRAFLIKVRPRMSQHEGREQEAIPTIVDASKARKIILEGIYKKIKNQNQLSIQTIDNLRMLLNGKYKINVKLSELLDFLEAKKCIITPKKVLLNKSVLGEEIKVNEIKKESTKLKEELKEKEIIAEQNISSTVIPLKIIESQALKLVDSKIKKKFAFFGRKEFLTSLELKYEPIYKVDFNLIKENNEFFSRTVFIDPLNLEFIHFLNNKFVHSTGLSLINSLSEEEINILRVLILKKAPFKELQEKTLFATAKLKQLIESLKRKKIIDSMQSNEIIYYYSTAEFDLPASNNKLHSTLNELPKQVVQLKKESLIPLNNSEEQVINAVKKLWSRAKVNSVTKIYVPLWIALLQDITNTRKRRLLINAVTGQVSEENKRN